MYEQLAFETLPKPDEEQALATEWQKAKEMEEYWREVRLELEDKHFKVNAGKVALEAIALGVE
ncbi:MAG: hypothetical protein D8G53_11750 [Candidatus Saccharimonas sp.]|nr:MAG: hypothetical protein D8G53_11750 [Candidatus Saccharimonas sp.]